MDLTTLSAEKRLVAEQAVVRLCALAETAAQAQDLGPAMISVWWALWS